MPTGFISALVEILIIFLVGYMAFWAIDRVAWPAGPPFKLIVQIIVLIIFLVLIFGVVGLFPSYHINLFRG